MTICGTQDGAQGSGMTCDQLDTRWYNVSRVAPANVPNRYGMAATYQKTSDGIKAYFTGGSNSTNQDVGTMDIATMKTSSSSSTKWSKGPDMLLGITRNFHTATWVDSPLNGVVVIAGYTWVIIQPITPVIVYDPNNGTWSGV
ncbi:hypothetical protein BGX34_003364, partial [Mortierella sp. NVP85]